LTEIKPSTQKAIPRNPNVMTDEEAKENTPLQKKLKTYQK
jgi:hypothetical protein